MAQRSTGSSDGRTRASATTTRRPATSDGTARARAGTRRATASAGTTGTSARARRSAASDGTARAETPARRPEVTLPLIGTVVVPPPERLVFYAALGLLTAFEIIEWPVAMVVAAGHFLSEQHASRALQEVGEAALAV